MYVLGEKSDSMLSQKLKTSAFLAVIILFFIPTLIQYDFDSTAMHPTGISFGLPRILSGDETFYLVSTYSIVNDFDLNISSNYDNALYNGTCDTGYKFRFVDIGRHTTNLPSGGIGDFPGRPIGLPVFASIFLFPFKNSCFLENFAVYLTLIVSLTGLLFLWKTLKHFGGENKKTLLVFLAFALATPLWNYSATFWTEPYLAAFAISSFYFFFVKQKTFLPASILSLGVLFAYSFAMVPFFFAVYLLLKKDLKRLTLFVIPFLAVLSFVLLYNNALYSDPFFNPRQGALQVGNPLAGIAASLFDPRFGIFLFSPFLLFAFLGFKKYFQKEKLQSLSILILFLVYLLFWSSFEFIFSGPGGYSNRYLVPILPLLAVPVLFFVKENKNKTLLYAFYILLAISFAVNLFAAFIPPAFYLREPWFLLEQFLRNPEAVSKTLGGF